MPDFVADVGNTRIKWGECADAGLTRTAALPLNDPKSWATTLNEWGAAAPSSWALAGTQPVALHQLTLFLQGRGHTILVLDDYRQLPISMRVDHPEKIGIDRLLNAVAVLPKGTPAIIIDAGSAVTVDLVDGDGVFRGGAIFPGFRLMAKALHHDTARLPLIEHFIPNLPLPGRNTAAAINAGITHAVAGGIDRIVRRLSENVGAARVYLAGGDAEKLKDLECRPEDVGPFLTLEGIRLAARGL